MIEETIVTETRRTTEATMRMEHNVQPDIPMTLTQRTQTPTISVVTQGTMFDQKLSTTATNTEHLSTSTDSTQTPPMTLPKPIALDVPTNTNSLQNLTRIINQEENISNKNYEIHTQNKVPTTDHPKPEILSPVTNSSAKLLAELAEMQIVPEPAPEMGYMPKESTAEIQRENISDRIKKLEVSQQTYADIPPTVVRPPVEPIVPSQPKESDQPAPVFNPYEMLLPQTSQVSHHLHRDTVISQSQVVTKISYTPDPIYRKPAHLDDHQQDLKDTNVIRSHSPRPSAEGIAMDKIWTTHKADEPKVFDSSVYHTSKNEFAEEKKMRFPATPISESETDNRYESASECENVIRLKRRNSTKETTQLFEKKIKEFENSPKHDYDLRAPGLVKQIPPMPLQGRSTSVQESPLPDVYLEPGSPPEICYAPRPATLERKQSLVEVMEQTIEKESINGPSKMLAGAVRMIPPPLKREELPTFKQTNGIQSNGWHTSNNQDKPQVAFAQPTKIYPEVNQIQKSSGYMADTEDTMQRKPNSASSFHHESTSKSINHTKQIFESFTSDHQQSKTYFSSPLPVNNGSQTEVPCHSIQKQNESTFEQSNAFKPFIHSHHQPNGSFQKVCICVLLLLIWHV